MIQKGINKGSNLIRKCGGRRKKRKCEMTVPDNVNG